MVSLTCPLCRTPVAVGRPELSAGECPGCGARYAGDGEDPIGGVAAALAAFGAEGLPVREVAEALFAADPGAAGANAAVASDERDGFYRWWVFVRPGDADAADVLRGLLAR